MVKIEAKGTTAWRASKQHEGSHNNLIIHGYVGLQGLIDELRSSPSIMDNAREAAIRFASNCDALTRMILREGGILTLAGFIHTPLSPDEFADGLRETLADELVLPLPFATINAISSSRMPEPLKKLSEDFPADSRTNVYLIHPDTDSHLDTLGSLYRVLSPRAIREKRHVYLQQFQNALARALSSSPQAQEANRTAIPSIIRQTLGDIINENGRRTP